MIPLSAPTGGRRGPRGELNTEPRDGLDQEGVGMLLSAEVAHGCERTNRRAAMLTIEMKKKEMKDKKEASASTGGMAPALYEPCAGALGRRSR